jgi:hypothetical protein
VEHISTLHANAPVTRRNPDAPVPRKCQLTPPECTSEEKGPLRYALEPLLTDLLPQSPPKQAFNALILIAFFIQQFDIVLAHKQVRHYFFGIKLLNFFG